MHLIVFVGLYWISSKLTRFEWAKWIFRPFYSTIPYFFYTEMFSLLAILFNMVSAKLTLPSTCGTRKKNAAKTISRRRWWNGALFKPSEHFTSLGARFHKSFRSLTSARPFRSPTNLSWRRRRRRRRIEGTTDRKVTRTIRGTFTHTKKSQTKNK